MTDSDASLTRPPQVVFTVDTPLVDAETDACYAWLQERYRRVAPHTRTRELAQQIDNDVKVCSAARWKRFAFPSDPYAPLRANFNNEDTKGQAVKVLVTKVKASADSPAPSWQARLVNSHEMRRGTGSDTTAAAPTREPSRHVWDLAGETVAAPSERPALGGYVQSPHSDALRFLVFPQRHHAALNDAPAESSEAVRARRATTPQRVPYYLRGTAQLDRDVVTPLTPVRAEAPRDGLARLLAASQLHVFAAWALPRRDARSGLLARPFWRDVDTLDAEVYGHSTQTERRYAPAKQKVERCSFVRHGVALTASRPDPRYGLRWEASVSTVGGSGRQKRRAQHGSSSADASDVHDDVVLALSAMDTYQSSSQTWRLPAWRRREPTTVTSGHAWSAGPGLEVTPADRCATVFGKLRAESWLDVPLASRFSLKLRQQSAFVQPFTPSRFADTHVADEAAEDGSAVRTDAAPAGWLRPHRYFWATQGPKWNPKLVRGFDNDYSSLHHAQRWYTLISAEVSRKKRKRGLRGVGGGEANDGDDDAEGRGGGFFSRIGVTAFANACFADTLMAPPRASVGCSLQSDVPRLTVDAFNKLIPSTFECSFSWFVAVKEKKLMTGLQPNTPEDQQFMRISPVETFRHMKCGLTWNF